MGAPRGLGSNKCHEVPTGAPRGLGSNKCQGVPTGAPRGLGNNKCQGVPTGAPRGGSHGEAGQARTRQEAHPRVLRARGAMSLPGVSRHAGSGVGLD